MNTDTPNILSVSWPGDQREPTKADPLTSAMVLSRIRAETETAKLAPRA